MKRLLVLLLLVAGMAVPSAEAGIITGSEVKVTGSLGTLGGGAFTVESPDSDPFLTFCLERDEYISYNTTYYAKLALAADDGGAGGLSPDPLDSRTAFLYSQFLDGTGYFTSLNTDVINGLQLAIWRTEEEVDSSYNVLGTPTQRNLAETYYNWATTQADGSLYGVQVMQLWGTYNPTTGAVSGYKQDQLVRVPDGGATLVLLGGTLLGIGALRRRLSR